MFKIDVGNMPSHLAMAFVERIKNEIHQRRIPSLYGGQSIVDASYNPLCLDLDTKIPLLDGRTLALRDIISEFEEGKENWAYSCNPETGKVVPGVINWAGVTRKNTDVIELTFDNGKTLVCTPDHKIPVFGKGFVEAQNLTENDSLIAFNTRNEPIAGGKTNTYQQVWDHDSKKWVWTHRMVGKFFRSKQKHQEFNYLPEYALKERTTLHHTSKALNTLRKNAEHRVKIKNQPLNLTFDMLQIVADIVKSGVKNKRSVLAECDKHPKLITLVKETNSTPLDYKNAQCKIDFDKFGYSKMDRLLAKYGYNNWKHFVKEVDNFNHRVVKITKVANRDTGTITIDGYHKWHDYHTFAIESGIFVKNSMNEDYFFPVTADGRGSSVEVMPGGQNLGEIDDLRYFNNRLARGLRVPSSYLPTGPDDSDRTLSDGRVGTALIQEYRFNQYCERLQNYMAMRLDEEFKLFLRWRGFNIDSGLFAISFNPPQNFAAYRQSELDTTRVQTYTTMESLPYISKRFALQRFLGLSEEEIAKNERMWNEENKKDQVEEPKGSDLRSIGVSPGDIQADTELGQELQAEPGTEAELGPEVVGPVNAETPGGTPPPGGAAPGAGAAAPSATTGSPPV
jgi:peroxiredoxin family protein